jgi:predicted DNA-binding transcriptional regulator AlpA
MRNDWVKSVDVCARLGISRDTLYRWIAKKILKKGKHYRNISLGGMRNTYQFHLKRIEQLINSD